MPESWLKLATKFGLWACLAIWLVYQMNGDLKSELRATKAGVDAINAAMAAHVASVAPMTAGLQQLVNLQLQQCVNSADDVLKREKCFTALQGAPSR
jgi:hypothetical protein